MAKPAQFKIAVGVLLAIALVRPARAWIYPEHRDIALAGLARLSAADRAALQKLWTEARQTAPERWCEAIDSGDQGTAPKCIDFSAWAGLAGDYSCSPKHLVAS